MPLRHAQESATTKYGAICAFCVVSGLALRPLPREGSCDTLPGLRQMSFSCACSSLYSNRAPFFR